MERITSAKNEKVVQWAKLETEKGRREQGAFLAEGVHLVLEALRWKVSPVALLFDETRPFPIELEPFVEDSLPWHAVSPAVIGKLTDAKTPQGVVAVLRLPWEREISSTSVEAAEAFLERETLLLVDAVQDPGNLGAIIRSADAFGVNAILLGRGTVDPYNGKVLRASMGSLFHLPVYKVELMDWLPWLKETGFVTVAADLKGRTLLHEWSFPSRVALVVGNEAKGIAPQHLALVTEKVRIAMPGHAESLNVTMAASVLLYERVRQQRVAE